MSSKGTLLLSRRDLISAAATAGILSTGFATIGKAAAADNQSDSVSGLVSVFNLGSVTLHSYMAPGSSSVVTTQIVETPNELHIIDTQFIQSIAKETRDYADTLGKPVAGIYLSHWHPDHVLGAAQYEGLPFFTTADIRADCDNYKTTFEKRKSQFGDSTPLILPEGSLKTGEHDWDGVRVVINQINDCEAEHALTFYFPDAGLMIVQDLMFNNVHAFPLGNHSNWIDTLKNIREEQGVRIIGCGHGLPATVGAVTDSIAYLEFQKAVFSEEQDADSAITALKSHYPKFEGNSVLRFVSGVYQ